MLGGQRNAAKDRRPLHAEQCSALRERAVNLKFSFPPGLLCFSYNMSNNSPANTEAPAPAAPSDFIRDIVAAHVAENKYPRIQTRFPPEPNGYLHIGHAKSICLNFGIAREFGGVCNLRMDDTNPTKEDVEYVDSIQADVNWLISGWAEERLGLKPSGKLPEAQTANGKPDFHLASVSGASEAERKSSAGKLEPFYASDYFDQIYEYAVALIKRGRAYVCDLTPDETDEYRRNAKESPFRNRSVEESLDLFTRMKNGEFPDGKRTLRAKIDVAAPTSGCATRSSTASATRSTTILAANGASIRCMTLRTA